MHHYVISRDVGFGFLRPLFLVKSTPGKFQEHTNNSTQVSLLETTHVFHHFTCHSVLQQSLGPERKQMFTVCRNPYTFRKMQVLILQLVEKIMRFLVLETGFLINTSTSERQQSMSIIMSAGSVPKDASQDESIPRGECEGKWEINMERIYARFIQSSAFRQLSMRPGDLDLCIIRST